MMNNVALKQFYMQIHLKKKLNGGVKSFEKDNKDKLALEQRLIRKKVDKQTDIFVHRNNFAV